MAYVNTDEYRDDPSREPAPATPPTWGAPANNPTSAPEQDYWGGYSGTRPHEYTSEQQKFDTFFKDYWAPDRSSVLSDLRFKPPTFMNPPSAPASAPSAPQQPTTWDMGTFSQRFGTPRTPQELIAMEGQLGQAGIKVLRNAAGVAGKIQLPNGQVVDVINAAGAGGRGFQWLTDEGGGGGQGPNVGGAAFNDPATAQWEQLLRQLVERMNQPQPTWSNSQMDLMQTQALDPLERQRQARKQQETQRLAARNITPESGIWREAMSNIDRQFDQARTQTQAGFATQAIGREDQLFGNNEQRALNAVNLFKQIPQMADSRLQLANSMLMPANPYQTLSLNNQYQGMAMQNQQYQNAQNQAFYGQLANLLYQFLNPSNNG